MAQASKLYAQDLASKNGPRSFLPSTDFPTLDLDDYRETARLDIEYATGPNSPRASEKKILKRCAELLAADLVSKASSRSTQTNRVNDDIALAQATKFNSQPPLASPREPVMEIKEDLNPKTRKVPIHPIPLPEAQSSAPKIEKIWLKKSLFGKLEPYSYKVPNNKEEAVALIVKMHNKLVGEAFFQGTKKELDNKISFEELLLTLKVTH